MFLGGFSSVLPLNGVAREILRNGHHASLIGLKNGRFSDVLGLIPGVGYIGLGRVRD